MSRLWLTAGSTAGAARHREVVSMWFSTISRHHVVQQFWSLRKTHHLDLILWTGPPSIHQVRRIRVRVQASGTAGCSSSHKLSRCHCAFGSSLASVRPGSAVAARVGPPAAVSADEAYLLQQPPKGQEGQVLFNVAPRLSCSAVTEVSDSQQSCTCVACVWPHGNCSSAITMAVPVKPGALALLLSVTEGSPGYPSCPFTSTVADVVSITCHEASSSWTTISCTAGSWA